MVEDMGGHDQVSLALLDEQLKGAQFGRLPGLGHVDQPPVRVAMCAAVAGKVLKGA